jgi:hypothetical protein
MTCLFADHFFWAAQRRPASQNVLLPVTSRSFVQAARKRRVAAGIERKVKGGITRRNAWFHFAK